MLIPALLKQQQQITYMAGEGNYTYVHFVDASPQIHARTLSHFAGLLPNFVRIHKTYLVNPNYIKDYHPNGSREASLQVSDQWLPVSRRRLRDITPVLEAVLITPERTTKQGAQYQKTKVRLSLRA